MSSSSGTSSSGTSSSVPPPNYPPPPNYSDKDYIPLDKSVAADNSFDDNKPSSITNLPGRTVESIISTIGNDNAGQRVNSWDRWSYKVAFQEEEGLSLSDEQVKQITSAARKVEPPNYDDIPE